MENDIKEIMISANQITERNQSLAAEIAQDYDEIGRASCRERV